MAKFNTLDKKYNGGLGKKLFNALSTKVTTLERMTSRVGVRPIILDDKNRKIDVLETSYDVILEQELKGMDELTFSIALSDEKRYLLKNEACTLMYDTVYIIRNIIDDKKNNNTDVYCEANWYDIAYADPFEEDEINWVSQEPFYILKDILEPTEWTIGTVEIETKKTLHLSIETNRLQALRKLEELCDAEIVFDTINKRVSLVEPRGRHTGASIMCEKNADNITRESDTRELITKIILYGKDNMTISDANDGIPYLENYTYTNKSRCQIVKDERYTNPYELKKVGEKALEEVSKPRLSYVTTVSELMTRSGLEHESFFMGGLVRVYDAELDLNVDVRILKWKVNVSELWNSEVTLESKAKSISELLTGTSSVEQFSVSGSSADYSNLSVYNQLLNSRADDGFFSWANSGWIIDPSIGSSGQASFKAIGERGKCKEIKQTCYPSSRDSYSISFKGQTSNLEKGEEARIGVEVIVNYEDGSSETRYISLI